MAIAVVTYCAVVIYFALDEVEWPRRCFHWSSATQNQMTPQEMQECLMQQNGSR